MQFLVATPPCEEKDVWGLVAHLSEGLAQQEGLIESTAEMKNCDITAGEGGSSGRTRARGGVFRISIRVSRTPTRFAVTAERRTPTRRLSTGLRIRGMGPRRKPGVNPLDPIIIGQFKDWYLSRGPELKDFNAAYRKWLRDEPKFARQRSRQRGSEGSNMGGSMLDAALDELRKAEAING